MIGQRNQKSWLVLLAVWATFLLYGAIAAPVPAVNEPHYLCKGKHFWQPDWCANDFFLASPNAHTVFYLTVGSLTRVMSFDQAARTGRALAALVLAWGWLRCLYPLFYTRWAPFWCAWMFLALAACGNFSGEWLVGGVEGKVFAYGFLLSAMGDALCDRPRLAAVWTGLAISFHPVVGLWGVFAFAGSYVVNQFVAVRQTHRVAVANRSPQSPSDNLRPADVSLVGKLISSTSCWTTVSCVLIIGLLSLPGLIPVFQLLTEHESPEVKFAATYVQVYFRLKHHLDPMQFSARAYVCYAGLLICFLFSMTWGGRNHARRSFDQVVIWAVLFAIIGVLIGYGPRPAVDMPYFALRMKLLKFYPFRLADVLLPIAVATGLTSVLERTLFHSAPSRRQKISMPFVSGGLLIMIAVLLRANSISETNRYSKENRSDWLDVCGWIDQQLPADALVQTPTNGWAFKWFAHRAEYVAFKDCPQNASGLVEWNRRLNFLERWYDQNYSDKLYSASELKGLHRDTGISHVLTDHLGPFELEPVYRNQTFQVYDLRMLLDK